MKKLTAVGLFGILIVLGGQSAGSSSAPEGSLIQAPKMSFEHAPPMHGGPTAPRMLAGVGRTKVAERSEVSSEVLNGVVKRYCLVCHNNSQRNGNLNLQSFDVAAATETADVAEKVIAKLRATMMPPPGMPRPTGDTLRMLYETLEARLDSAAAANPNPGHRTFQRLNRAEYTRAIREL